MQVSMKRLEEIYTAHFWQWQHHKLLSRFTGDFCGPLQITNASQKSFNSLKST
jgi:hypothetical protein